MQSTTPEVDAPRIEIAKGQAGFVPIIGARIRNRSYPVRDGLDHNCILLAFRPTEAERVRLAEGADVYVSLLTWGGPMQGIIVLAGKEEASAVFNIRATGAEQTPLPRTESPLVAHARRELERAGLFGADSDYGGELGEAALRLVETLAAQEHSGTSAMMTTALFSRLARFGTLTPITSDPGEWMDVADASGGKPGTWQNTRDGNYFSRDGGRTWYNLNDVARGDGDPSPTAIAAAEASMLVHAANLLAGRPSHREESAEETAAAVGQLAAELPQRLAAQGELAMQLAEAQALVSGQRRALEVARHELTTLHGLWAFDAAADQGEQPPFLIDTSAALKAIDAVLPPAPGACITLPAAAEEAPHA